MIRHVQPSNANHSNSQPHREVPESTTNYIPLVEYGALQESSTTSSHMQIKKEENLEIKESRHERRMIPLELNLPLLTALIS